VPATIGRFTVIGPLGEGGMGVVYAARDEGLGRRVAVKTVKGTVADETARQRLLREARVAAGVNHPNVCHVYEVGEHEGSLFVAMELLEGESLAARLARGPLPLPEAGAVALGCLAGLEALHRSGIVHRDLKPSNVFLTPQGPKILDLGLALPLSEVTKGDVRLTKSGVMVGTPGFMPPEQWGSDEVRPTADLFAMGALLFEMVAGRPAYPGDNVLEVYHAIVHEPPPTLEGSPAVAALDRVIQRALAPVPDDRPASAAAMAADVREALALATTADAPRARSAPRIVVLPFRCLRPDPDTDFLRFGLAEALAASLATVGSLVVRSSQVASRFATEPVDLAAVAAGAQVDLVLTGSILRAGDRVRATIELVEAPAGTVVRTDSLTVPVGDLFALQDDLARRVLASVSGPLTRAAGREALQRDVPTDPEAYELYLRANQVANNSSMLEVARDLYRAALAKDPRYAPAWARLGRVHRVLAKFGQGAREENLRAAEEAFARALELNPDLAAAHDLYTGLEVETGRADRALVRLLDRAPAHRNDAEVFTGLVLALRFGGLLDASVAAHDRARRIDPGVRTSVAYTHWMRGDFERALLFDNDDRRWITQYSLPRLGRGAEAAAISAEVAAQGGSALIRAVAGTNLAAVRGEPRGVEEGLAVLESSGFADPEGLYFGARSAAHVGRLDSALLVLDRVVAGGFFVPDTMRADPWLDALRPDPRFASLLERAEEGRRRATALYREHGGEALLGVAAPAGPRA
jgi:TolB-like protein